MIKKTNQHRNNFKKWLGQSTAGRIFHAIILIGSIGVLVRLVNALKEIVIAAQFGVGDTMDIYIMALVIPTFVVSIISGSLNVALIPVLVHCRQNNGHKSAQHLFSSATILSFSVLFLLTLLAYFCAPPLLPFLAKGFSVDKIQTTIRTFHLLLPIILLSGLSSNWSALINAGEKFRLTSVAPIFRPLIIALGALALTQRFDLNTLVLFTVLGFAIESGVLAIGVKAHHYSIVPRWYGWTPELKKVVKLYIPMVAATLLMNMSDLIDQSMAALLPAGSVSTLIYGSKIITLMMSLAVTAIGTAVLPAFSKLVATEKFLELRKTYRDYAIALSAISILITALFWVESENIIRLFFKRGNFSLDDVATTAQVQKMFALQIPFYVLSSLTVRAVSTLQENRTILIAAGINLVVNVSGNILFMRWFGLSGIALSTAIVYAVNLAFLYITFRRVLRKRGAYP